MTSERPDYDTRVFCVFTWGCSASAWLGRSLNAHPEILCLHNFEQQRALTVGSGADSDTAYARVLERVGRFYAAAGDVHGMQRDSEPALREALGDRFRSAVLVRDPVPRIRSYVTMQRRAQERSADHVALPRFREVRRLVRRRADCDGRDPHVVFFAHGVQMLNSIVDEARLGCPIERMEDVTADATAFDRLTRHLSAGEVGFPESLFEQVRREKIAVKAGGRAEPDAVFQEWSPWQRALWSDLLTDEARRLYAGLGYRAGLDD